MGHGTTVEAGGPSRRELLKRGAALGAAAAWTVPVVQVISMTPAHADTPSAPTSINNPPPKPTTGPSVPPAAPSEHNSPSAPVATEKPSAVAPASPSAATAAPQQPKAKASLPNTGSAILSGPALAIGASAIALGAGLVAAARHEQGDDEAPSAPSA